jgi:3-oxoacyl-[acyl-carrier protein] reductase
METRGWGRVIFNSSVAGFTGGVVGPHYASSKSAMHGLLHWLASIYGPKGITVNGVAPALIQDTVMLPQGSEELAQRKYKTFAKLRGNAELLVT